MPYYHGTFFDRLPSIRKHGLGGLIVERNFPGSEPGVYLGTTPDVCVAMLLEHYLEFGESQSSPPEQLKRFCVIVIDDSRVDATRLGPDPQTEGFEGTLLYQGVIDITSMPVLSMDHIYKESA